MWYALIVRLFLANPERSKADGEEFLKGGNAVIPLPRS